MSRVLKGAINQITSKYSFFTHRAVDVVKYQNKIADIIAHSDGVVVEVVTGKSNDLKAFGKDSYGNYVKLKHANGMYTLYAHLKNVYVKKNDYVSRGTILGTMGKSGKAINNHLHFEVQNRLRIRMNPTKYLENDLPRLEEKVHVVYQTYDLIKKKWLPNVIDDENYAGNFGNPISSLYIHLTSGDIQYRVHELNGKWLPIIKNRDEYAGNIGKKIDGIQMKCDTTNISYRVHLQDFGWLSWVDNEERLSDGYVGIYGYEIDALQIKVL